MYKVYNPLRGFKLIGRASSIEEAFKMARAAMLAAGQEIWVDDRRGVLCAVARPQQSH